MRSELLGLLVCHISVNGFDAIFYSWRSVMILTDRAMLYRLIEVDQCTQVLLVRSPRAIVLPQFPRHRSRCSHALIRRHSRSEAKFSYFVEASHDLTRFSIVANTCSWLFNAGVLTSEIAHQPALLPTNERYDIIANEVGT
jgi:hypothetical protein